MKRGMSDMQFLSPLRYPGGKGRLTHFMAKVVELNELSGAHYAEPYAGGAGIAMGLLLLGQASHVHINDINASIHAFWYAVLHHTDELCGLVLDTPVTMDEWHRQRALQDVDDVSPLELGFSTFFLNRTNRSGIIRGGVIGGKGQAGRWKLDARFNRRDLVRRIEQIARHADRISLYNQDAAKFIERVVPTLPAQSLVYLDPPYYVKGKGLYEDHYGPDDHARIAELVRRIAQAWIVSYDDVPEIRQLYAGLRQETFGLHYSAHWRFRGTEVVVYRDGLRVPTELQPSRGDTSRPPTRRHWRKAADGERKVLDTRSPQVQ